jgi:alkylation response protein AidB-like acyl-CoA dehydrogenase
MQEVGGVVSLGVCPGAEELEVVGHERAALDVEAPVRIVVGIRRAGRPEELTDDVEATELRLRVSREGKRVVAVVVATVLCTAVLPEHAAADEETELLTLEAADRKNKGLNMTKEGAMAKYYASEVSVYCANEAVQIFGGYGYTKDFPVEKFYRDCKLCTIGEGTSEIQKLVISRNILKD